MDSSNSSICRLSDESWAIRADISLLAFIGLAVHRSLARSTLGTTGNGSIDLVVLIDDALPEFTAGGRMGVSS